MGSSTRVARSGEAPHQSLSEVEAGLRRLLAAPLPGVDAQVLLAPRPRPGWQPGHFPEASRAAAALILLYAKHGEPHVLLTVRSATMAHHAGQVCLPGGAVDAGETIEIAAIREAYEEVGVQPEGVSILGALTPLHIPVSGFVLYTVVGITHVAPRFHVAEAEVERVLEIPLADLLHAEPVFERRALRDGGEYDVPHFDLAGARIWGATAMILSEFRAIAQSLS